MEKKLRLYRFVVVEKEWDTYTSGLVITESVERAWKIFDKRMKTEYSFDDNYYKHDNWVVKESELSEASHWNYHRG